MPVYHQMGHHSDNLLHQSELGGYRGAILSPVNYLQANIEAQVSQLASRDGFETIFDPQLYFPNTERGCLREWAYFPSDVDSADLQSAAWWQQLMNALVTTCNEIGVSAICSPAAVPRVFSDEYFTNLIERGAQLKSALQGSGVTAIQSAVVGLTDLSQPGRALAVASILSATRCEKLYLIFVGSTDPRRELSDPEELKGAMRLISALESSDLRILVGFCSSDILLWKAAGASSCATGKFFNLRRFTSSRFEEPTQGGGQLPYWFEESLLGFLRESDLLRVSATGLLSPSSGENPYSQQILSKLTEAPGSAWVGLGWRQFMYWFMNVENRLHRGEITVRDLLRQAEENWQTLEDSDVLMEEVRNDGRWLRPWRRALAEYGTH
jgi:hypothetical protein